jgi:hypothetical protein
VSEERYGRLTGKRRLSSTLVLARDEAGAIAGCAGIEIAVVDKNSLTVMSRERGEQTLAAAISALPARQRTVAPSPAPARAPCARNRPGRCSRQTGVSARDCRMAAHTLFSRLPHAHTPTELTGARAGRSSGNNP